MGVGPYTIAANYPPVLIVYYYEQSTKRYAKELLDQLTIERHANHADQKGMTKLVASLEKIARENKDMSAEEVANAFTGKFSEK